MNQQIVGALRDLLQSVESEWKLGTGFGGMGHNILVESASKKWMNMRYARKVLDSYDSALGETESPLPD